MPLNSAVVGLGTIADVHAKSLSASGSTRLVAGCDVRDDRVAEFSGAFGVAGYTDLERMIDDETLDWVHVCTPVQTHFDIATKLIEADVDVLVEKPITATHDEYLRLQELATDMGVRLTEVHNLVYHPTVRRLLEIVRSGRVGTVRSVTVVSNGNDAPNEAQRGDWVLELDGGELEEGVVHPVYLALRIGGYPGSRGTVRVDKTLAGEYDDGVPYDGLRVSYVSDDGVSCTVEAYANAMPRQSIRVFGSEGNVVADLLTNSVFLSDRDYTDGPVPELAMDASRVADSTRSLVSTVRQFGAQAYSTKLADSDDVVAPWLRSHSDLVDREAASLLGDADPAVPADETRWTSRIMERIRRQDDV